MCDHRPVTPAQRLAVAERACLAARDTRDRLDVARATGLPPDRSTLDAEARSAATAARDALERLLPEDAAALPAQDRRALQALAGGSR
jgi:hypothetical protein